MDTSKFTKSKWLKASDLPLGKLTPVTVKAEYDYTFELTGETKGCLEFHETSQIMTLNPTQGRTMTALFGDNSKLWVGQRINLQAVPSNFQGKPTILISEAQAQLPTFNGVAVGSAATPPTAQPVSDTQFWAKETA